jgi:drug/metabolite transporter (DMT)-like permease
VTSAAAAATGILVGSAIVATRFVIDQSTPLSLALLRYLIGFCVLLPALLSARSIGRIRRGDVLPIGLLGIAQFGILIALLNPITAAGLGALVLDERVTLLTVAGVACVALGLAAASSDNRLTEGSISGAA